MLPGSHISNCRMVERREGPHLSGGHISRLRSIFGGVLHVSAARGIVVRQELAVHTAAASPWLQDPGLPVCTRHLILKHMKAGDTQAQVHKAK
eukprot:49087-Pelagomonas_calceolata.AAC.1